MSKKINKLQLVILLLIIIIIVLIVLLSKKNNKKFNNKNNHKKNNEKNNNKNQGLTVKKLCSAYINFADIVRQNETHKSIEDYIYSFEDFIYLKDNNERMRECEKIIRHLQSINGEIKDEPEEKQERLEKMYKCMKNSNNLEEYSKCILSKKNNKSNNKSNNEIKKKFRNFKVQDKYYTLVKYIGEANIVELDSDKYVHSITWQSPLDKYNGQGKYGGLDYIKLSGYITRKYHPIPADCFVIVGKYINVPNHLMGPIKYASETINIEQLFVPQIHNKVYDKTGKKEVALVTGSCASITISAITIKFVEDMIMKYKDNLNVHMPSLYKEFRKEYDNRVLNYLCGGGTKPAIPWYSAEFFGEEETWTDGNFPQCMNSPGVSNLKEKFSKNNHNHNHNKNHNNKNTCEEYDKEECPPTDCSWEDGECKAA